MQRLTCGVALFVFILLHSPSTLNSRVALRLAGYANAAVQEETVPLAFDTPLAGTIPPRSPQTCGLGTTQYAIQYPGGATQIRIEISTTSRLDLSIYARFGQSPVTEDGRIVTDFLARGGAPLTFPVTGPHLFEAGTYFIAVGNCSPETANYTIRASLLVPTDADTVELSFNKFPPDTNFGEIPAAAPGSCSLGRTQYRVTMPAAGPCGGILVSVSAFSNQNISLYVRREERVAVADGRVVADLASPSPARAPFIALPSGGTFFIAIGNCSTEPANYIVSLNQAVIDPPFGPLINGCDLSRNPSGAYVLTIFGAGIKEGATFTVNGVSPKKTQFIELEPGSTNTYRRIRLVKKFCGGLPGIIIVTNPGPCGGSGSPFFCNQACAN